MAPNGFWEIDGEPYTTAPGSSFRWFRSRIEGGRTNHWGRIALRFGPADFHAHSTDGMGDDWPITYEELAPYYDKVESYIGVFGSKENIPNSPDGVFMEELWETLLLAKVVKLVPEDSTWERITQRIFRRKESHCVAE